ncbi:unnamed protein product [Mytilus edulis]|uniref:Uncharacterized protein n=1 Tax=Mytilus edulis TaxID=6550 RepID=A0A8S3SCF0_MYTED|nr:unnamed protein product [Mytilus edulis]
MNTLSLLDTSDLVKPYDTLDYISIRDSIDTSDMVKPYDSLTTYPFVILFGYKYGKKQNIQYNTVLTIKSRITYINIEQAHKGCSYGKICKNENGLKILRTKMDFSVEPILERCKGPPDEMNQKTQHSVQHLHVQEEEVTEEDDLHDKLGINLNSQQEGEKNQGKEEDQPTPRIK